MKMIFDIIRLILNSAQKAPVITMFLVTLAFLAFVLYSAMALARDGVLIFVIYSVLALCAFGILVLLLMLEMQNS